MNRETKCASCDNIFIKNSNSHKYCGCSNNNKRYYNQHKEQQRNRAKQYRLKHRDKVKKWNVERTKRYKTNSLQKERHYIRRLKQLETIKKVDSKIPKMFRRDMLKLFDYKCFVCGKNKCSNGRNLHLDHINPLSSGNTIVGNCSVLCDICNCSKHNKLAEQFYTEEQIANLKIINQKYILEKLKVYKEEQTYNIHGEPTTKG